MVDKDLRSTDLSVSGDEEGHSTILLTHDIFLVLIGVRVISQRWFATKLHINGWKSYFCCLICIIFSI